MTECIQLEPDRTFVSMSQAEGCLLSKLLVCPPSYDWTAATLLLLLEIESTRAFVYCRVDSRMKMCHIS